MCPAGGCMDSALVVSQLVERYLRSRGADPASGDESFVVDAPIGSLHVYVGQMAANSRVIAVQVTGPRSFPAADHPWLSRQARKWNRRGELVEAVLCRSIDPARIGVVAEGAVPIGSGTGFQEFADVVDTSIARAGEFFAELMSAPPDRHM
jgi:hypothetical protein